MFGKKESQLHQNSWSSSQPVVKQTIQKTLPWKKNNHITTRAVDSSFANSKFSNFNDDVVVDNTYKNDEQSRQKPLGSPGTFRQQVKVSPEPHQAVSGSAYVPRLSASVDEGSERRKIIGTYGRSVSPMKNRRVSNDNNPNKTVSTCTSNSSSRRYLPDSSPSSSYRRSVAEDDDHHHHLIMFESHNGLDNDATMTHCCNSSELGGSIPSITYQRSFCMSEDEVGDGWSIGVRRFQSHGDQSEETSVFNPSDCNVGNVPAASHVRGSLLKKEFKTIKESLAQSYKKYRDRKKRDGNGEKNHAIAYQYVDNWLKKKKVASNNSRISKHEYEIFYSIFIKKIQSHFAETNIKVLNYDMLIEELVESKLFAGRIEANNFLMKINLDDDGMISRYDLIACLQSSNQDLNVNNFKLFVKKMKKHEERRKKLDETQEKAREHRRQQQISSFS